MRSESRGFMVPPRQDDSLSEPLILSSPGTKGYLKYPRAFTDEFDFVGKHMPNPTPRLSKKGGKVQLIYEWTEEQLTQAAKDAEKYRATNKRAPSQA